MSLNQESPTVCELELELDDFQNKNEKLYERNYVFRSYIHTELQTRIGVNTFSKMDLN